MPTVSRLRDRHLHPCLFQTGLHLLCNGSTFAFPCVRVHQKVNLCRHAALLSWLSEDGSEFWTVNAFFLPKRGVWLKFEGGGEPFVVRDHEQVTGFRRLKPSLWRFEDFMGSA